MPDWMDRRIAALGKLGRTKGGRAIIRDHGPAILSLMATPPAQPPEVLDGPAFVREAKAQAARGECGLCQPGWLCSRHAAKGGTP